MKRKIVKEIKDVEKLSDGGLRITVRIKHERSDTALSLSKMEFRILKQYAQLW